MPCRSASKKACDAFFKIVIFLVATLNFAEFLVYVIFIFPSISEIGFVNYEHMITICFQIIGGIYIVSSLILFIGCYFESRLYNFFFISLLALEIGFLTFLFIYALIVQPSVLCNLLTKIASDLIELCTSSPGVLVLTLFALIIFKALHMVLLIAFDYRIQLKVMTKKARETFAQNIREQMNESD